MGNSIDLVDTAFNYMDIDDEECRLKTVCEMERYAVNHPLAKLAINTVNNNLSGLSKYQDAIEAGMNGYDCTLLSMFWIILWLWKLKKTKLKIDLIQCKILRIS